MGMGRRRPSVPSAAHGALVRHVLNTCVCDMHTCSCSNTKEQASTLTVCLTSLQGPWLAASLEARLQTLAESWGPACLFVGLGSSSTDSHSFCHVQQLGHSPALQQLSGKWTLGFTGALVKS